MPESTQPPFPQVTAANAAAVLGSRAISRVMPAERLPLAAHSLGGRFVDSGQLLLSWPERFCPWSGYSSMSPVSAPF